MILRWLAALIVAVPVLGADLGVTLDLQGTPFDRNLIWLTAHVSSDGLASRVHLVWNLPAEVTGWSSVCTHSGTTWTATSAR